jgi:hypothetical protein
MRDHLIDIVQHTSALGCIDTIKITGDDASTIIESLADDKSVVLKAALHSPSTELKGTFGMPNLVKLNTLLNIPEYREDAKITVTKQQRNGEDVPVGLHFENAMGDFKNDYRFMTTEVVNEKLKSPKFKGVNWVVTFQPQLGSIQRFKFQASANSDENVFTVKTEGDKLKFYFGDHSSHAGEFVFESGITGKLTKEWQWPVLRWLTILNLDGDKVVQISDVGAAMITVDSGLIKYEYVLPAQAK